ncbi:MULTISPECIES: MFS transporter [unclassified Pseudonocardia]|uniref:MFS transporter n=1 Tax=unclassified Pseudonocardia TaxID=2619320 RepID=UPI00095DD5B1|nr:MULTISPECIES: MFS transporter [unclassified Pseudonocardia]OLM34520.1 Transporter, MFS superfamily [Pseudonocardia sp. Ae717_Ps2]
MTSARHSIGAEPTATTLMARLERIPHSRWHVKVRLIIGVVTFFEAFDQLLVAYTLPSIRQEWALGTGQMTLAVTAGSVGMLVGALVSGWSADTLGRVRTIRIALLLTVVASIGLFLSPSFGVFVLLRFVQGLGIGGEVPVAAAYIGELARAHGRGRFVLLYELVFPAGTLFAALLATWMVPSLGWRSVYLVGAIPVVMLILIRRNVPESPRWLAARGRYAEADVELVRIEQAVERSTRSPLPAPAAAAVTVSEAPAGTSERLRELVLGRYRGRLVLVCGLWFTAFFVNYGLTSWLPTIYTGTYGVPLGTALQLSLLATAAGFCGCVLAALGVDRIGRRAVLFTGMLLASAALVLLAVLGATDVGQVALLTTVAALFSFAANITLYLYSPELFPTRSRALGTSIGAAFNRIGVILGPIVVAAAVVGGSLTTAFAVLGGVAAVGAVLALFGPETRNRQLEEVSP